MGRDLVRVAVEAADVLDERFREQIDRILETQREFSNRLIAIERQLQRDPLEAIREATGGAWDGSEPAKVEGTVVKPEIAKPAWWDDERAQGFLRELGWKAGEWQDRLYRDFRHHFIALADAIIDAELITRDELVAEERRKALNEAADAVIDWSRQGYVNTGTLEKIADNIRRRAEGADE